MKEGSYWTTGIMYWYERNGKYYLNKILPELPLESWGALYVYGCTLMRNEIRYQLIRKPSPSKHAFYEWVTEKQILKHLEKGE